MVNAKGGADVFLVQAGDQGLDKEGERIGHNSTIRRDYVVHDGVETTAGHNAIDPPVGRLGIRFRGCRETRMFAGLRFRAMGCSERGGQGLCMRPLRKRTAFPSSVSALIV
jgi:hypothetical protein